MGFVRRFRWSVDTLSGRLAVLFVLLVLPPTIVSLHLAWESYTEHTTRAKLQVRQFATLTATYESKFFDDTRRILQRLGGEQLFRNDGAPDCGGLLGEALERTPEFDSLGYFNIDGQKVCGPLDVLTDVSGRGWMRDVRRFRGFVISDYTVAPTSPYPVIFAAQAVYGAEGKVQGVLAASIRLFWLSAFIREISLPPESVFFLIDSNGNVLADRAALLDDGSRSTPADTVAVEGGGTLYDFVGQDFAAAVLSRSVSDFISVGRDGVSRVFASVALPHGDVTVLFGMPTISAVGWLEKDLVNRVLGLAAILLAGVGAAWLGTRYLVTRWTMSLRRMARAYGSGNYTEKASFEDAPRELRDLGETLTLMAHRIETREDELRTSLEQKDFFLREIHHRVKNNLQIVSSLLNIRGGGIRGDVERAALNEVKAHVRALALVHRHLYESDDIRRVNLRSFMTELCQSAMAGLSRPSQNVSLDVRIPEFMISTDNAIPIALLVTEAMTNSLKHAFPDGRGGRIQVVFEQTGPRAGVLTVADDGVGLPHQDCTSNGLGLQLIEAFAKQIGGHLKISGPPGMVVKVSVDDHVRKAPEPLAKKSGPAAAGSEAAA